MNINKKKLASKQTEPVQKESVIVQELNIMSADRSRKDVSSARNAQIAAESVYFPNRTRLYDLYDDILLDGHLSGIIDKRLDNVLNKELAYEVNGKKVDAMDDLIESENFREMMTKLFEEKTFGISGIECLPGDEFNFVEIPRKHIKPEKKIIAIEQSGETGMEYEDLSLVWVVGKPKNLGLLLKCSFYALMKRGNMADWAQYVEIFGQPVRIIKYDAYDTKTKFELKQVLDESGSSLALMIPKQADFEMKDGKQSNGTGELQEKFKAALDAEMSIIILGNTESTTSSKSSGYAQSKEHGKQQLEITKSDLVTMRNQLNSKKLFNILKSYGYPVAEGGKFVFKKEIDIDFLIQRLEIDQVVSTKVPVSDDYWYETYGITKPDNYDELKKKMEDDKALQLQPIQEDSDKNPTDKGPKKPINNGGKKTIEKAKLTAMQRLLVGLADFFDPAP